LSEKGTLSADVVEFSDRVLVTVRDDGSGIKREIVSKIFDPFFTTKHKGTGLGLSIVASIISEHHGRINVDSEEGKGATVFVELPVSQGEGARA
jgi:two-component system, NtrC family, sensor kinase